MNLDSVIIVLCIAAAVIFIGNRAYRAVKGRGGCSCGCNCARTAAACRSCREPQSQETVGRTKK